jgi:acyl-CoA reductase-like NAD-dependent aldehyde dehydrogenase
MFQLEDPLAIPLWINGHAYLTMAPAFLDVRNLASGQVLRRTPMCGPDEAEKAVEAARAASGQWAAQTAGARADLLAAVSDALEGYASHFSGLLVEEAGMENDVATAEVNAAVALLRAPTERSVSGVLGIVGDSVKPLLGALQIAVPALVAGAVVVVRPHPETPSALFALAELTGRCGFPGGVFNVLHGGKPAIAGLRSQVDVTLFFS